MNRVLSLTLGLLALSPGFAVRAADIQTQSVIDTVKLFTDRAEVTRIVEFQTNEPGRHRLIVDQLPQTILSQSLQLIPGTATEPVRLGQVSLVTNPLADYSDAAAQALLDEIQTFERQKAVQSNVVLAEETKLSFIRNLSDTLAEQQAETIRQATANSSELIALIDLVGAQSLAARSTITTAKERIEDIGEQIELAKRQLQQLEQGAQAEYVAAIDFSSEAAASGVMRLSYQVRMADWQSLLEARLSTDRQELTFEQLAMVNQRTGEDWVDVELQLSTVQPVTGSLPELEPWVIDIQPALRSMSRSLADDQRIDASIPIMAEAAMARPVATQQTSGLDVRYIIDGRVTIPSGGSNHQVLVGRTQQSPTVTRKTVPSLEARAYLIASFDYAGTGPVPAGEVRLFRDGGFVGTIGMNMLVPGAPVEMQFGHDDRIDVTYRLDRDGRSSEGIITDYRRTDRNFETVITNHHDEPVEIVMLDQYPVARDERIEVELSDRTTSPLREDVNGRDGVVAWDLELAAGESQTIRFGYSVVHPADLEITDF